MKKVLEAIIKNWKISLGVFASAAVVTTGAVVIGLNLPGSGSEPVGIQQSVEESGPILSEVAEESIEESEAELVEETREADDTEETLEAEESVEATGNQGGNEGGGNKPANHPTKPGNSTQKPTTNPTPAPTPTPDPDPTPVPVVTDPVAKEYVVTLYNGTEKIKEVKKAAGTFLKDIAAPYQDGRIFLGWFLDAALTKKVGNADALAGDLALYGNYGEAYPLSESGSPNYASALDVDKYFTITVDAHSGDATAEAVLGALRLTNLSSSSRTDGSDSLEKDVLTAASLGSGKFRVGVKGGFQEGATYKLELLTSDKLPGLTFDGCAKEVVNYNFTVAKKEVLNLALDEDMKYLPATALSTEEAGKVLAYSGLYRATQDASGNQVYEATNAFGSFTYTQGAYRVGDIVAVYSGKKPNNRDITDANTEDGSQVAYVEITEVNTKDGITTYSYKSAKATDVLFTPDVLPVDIDAGDGVTGWSAEGSSLTIQSSKLDFTTGYETIGLDFKTVVEAGDFMTFYTGTYGADSMTGMGYGKIVSVTAKDGITEITYVPVSEQEVISSMDLYSKAQISQEQLAKMDENVIVETVTKQVMDSGFAQEAGMYLATLAVETDEVKELLGEEELTFGDCIVTYRDGTIVGSEGNAFAENVFNGGGEGMPEVNVNVSKKLEHFEQGTGVRVELAVKYGFDIQKTGSNKKIAIEMTAIFENEVLLSVSTKGGAIWKTWGIIPYIYDYEMTGNIDQGLYTGIAVTATAKLDEDEEPFGPEMLKPEGLEDYGQKILDLGNSIQQMMEASKLLEPESEGSATGGLIDKYTNFVEEANDKWIDLVDVPILSVSGAVDPFYVLAYSFDANFVVSANLNVAIGMSFQYEKSQRHTVNMRLFHQNECKTDTVDLGNEYYQFDFYVMGTMGLRAGIRAKVLFGLFSTKLDGIGVQLEAGVYAKLWGYFYYCLSWDKANGKKSSATGAMYIEIGAYLEVNLCLEVLNGSFAFSPTLYSGEWPIWNVGERENVLDFAYEEFEPDSFDMVRDTTIVVPTDVFTMTYLDLKEGGEGEKNYDADVRANRLSTSTKYDDEKRFFIEISKPFEYNPITNTISINPAEGYYSYEGTLTITWKQPDITYASKPVTRTFGVTWTDPDKGTCLIFNTNGGSLIRTQISNPGEEIIPVKDPAKVGYAFAGWYSDAEFKNKTTVPAVMPAADTTLYAKWVPVPNQYTVEHIYEGLNRNYVTGSTVVQKDNVSQNKRVYTDDVIDQKQIVNDNIVLPRGFEVNYERTTDSAKVAPDGSTVVKIYYDRQIHSVTYTMGVLKDSNNPDVVYNYRYEDAIYAPTMYMVGYTFKGWDAEIAKTMDLENLTYNAVWEPNPNTPYYVENYAKTPGTEQYMMLGGAVGKLYKEGATGTRVAVKDNLLKDQGYTFVKASVNGVDTTLEGSGIIDAQGRLVIRYYYEPVAYDITFDANGGLMMTQQPAKYYHGTAFNLENTYAQRTGYTFLGWVESEEAEDVLKEISNTRSGDITLIAKWAKKKNTISLYDTDGTTVLGNVTATYEEVVPALSQVPTKAGYEFRGFYTAEGTPYYDQDGAGLVLWEQVTDIALKAKWVPGKVAISFDVAGGESIAAIEGTYLSKFPALPTPKKVGYDFAGWMLDGALITEQTILRKATENVLVASWTPSSNTVYTVESYVPAEDYSESAPKYTKKYAEERRGTTGETVTINPNDFTFFGYVYMPGFQQNVLTSTIAADGSTVLKLYYKEAGKYAISYNYSTEEFASSIENATYIMTAGENLTLPSTVTDDTKHLRLTCWKAVIDGETVIFQTDAYFTVTNYDVTFEAVWAKDAYEVRYKKIAGFYEENFEQRYEFGAAYTIPEAMYDTPVQVNEKTNKLQYKEFLGWYTNIDPAEEGGTWYMPGQEVTDLPITDESYGTKFVNLFAQWSDWKDIPEGQTPYYVTYSYELGNNDGTRTHKIVQFGAVGEQTQAKSISLIDYSLNAITQKTIEAVNSSNEITTEVAVTGIRNRHSLTLDYNGGTCDGKTSLVVNDLVKGSNLSIVMRDDTGNELCPEKAGYEFLGWNILIPEYMPAYDIHAVACYRQTGLYQVEVQYQTQNLDGAGYTTVSTEKILRPVGSFTMEAIPSMTGFSALPASSIEVTAEGPNTYVVQYDRKEYTVTWNPGEGALAPGSEGTVTVKFGAAIPVGPALERAGYTGAWNNVPATMPAGNLSFAPTWTARKVGYDVVFQYELATGTYAALYSYHREDYAGTQIEPSPEIDDAYPEAKAKVAVGYAKPVAKSVVLEGDGSTIVYYNYKLVSSFLSYELSGGVTTTGNYAKAGKYKYGTVLQIPLVSHVEKPGFRAVGWYNAADSKQTIITDRTIKIGATDVVYKMKWEPLVYAITYDLGITGATNQTNPASYQYGMDTTLSAASLSGYAFKSWQWDGEGSMPEGVTIENGVVHVSETARGDLKFKAVWEQECDQFYALMEEGSSEIYTANYPKGKDVWIRDIAVPVKEGYVFAYWTKKVPDAKAGYYTVKISDNTRVATLNVNTDFVTAHWMKVTPMAGGAYSIHVNSDLEWNKAVELLKSDNRYKGITLESDININIINKAVFDTLEEGYVIDGAKHSISVKYMKDALVGKNCGTITNLNMEGVVKNTIENPGTDSAFGVFARENYGTVTYCSLGIDNGLLAYRMSVGSNATYIGGLVGKNHGTIHNCSVRNCTVSRTNDDVNDSFIGGLVGYNAPEGEIAYCEVKDGFVSSGAIAENQTAYLGGIVGQNMGLIRNTNIKNSRVGFRKNEDGTISGKLYAGGFAGIDAIYEEAVTEKDTRGIRDCSADDLTVSSDYIAGGIMAECNYTEIRNNSLNKISVSGNQYAGLMSGIYAYNREVGGYNYISNARVEAGENGNACVVAGVGRKWGQDGKVNLEMQVRSKDNLTKVINGSDVKAYNKGLFYGTVKTKTVDDYIDMKNLAVKW